MTYRRIGHPSTSPDYPPETRLREDLRRLLREAVREKKYMRSALVEQALDGDRRALESIYQMTYEDESSRFNWLSEEEVAELAGEYRNWTKRVTISDTGQVHVTNRNW